MLSCENARSVTQTLLFLKQNGIESLDVLVLRDPKEIFESSKAHFTSACSVHTLLTDADTSLPCTVRYDWEPGAALTAWDSLRMECGTADWMRVCVGNTQVLLCPANGTTAELPAEWHSADLVLFDRSVPAHVTALSAQAGLVRCEEDRIPYLTKGLPWGSYPLTLQTENDTETVYMLKENGTVFYNSQGG